VQSASLVIVYLAIVIHLINPNSWEGYLAAVGLPF
jgi:hypothetical protein